MQDKACSSRNKTISLLNADAAGIDIGGSFHFVAVPADRDNEPVRRFDNFDQATIFL